MHTPRPRSWLCGFAGCILSATACATLHAQTYTCLPDTAEMAIVLRNYVLDLVTTSDPRLVAKRERYGLLPADSADVVVVTKANECSRAGTAFHEAVSPEGTPPVDRTLVVVKIGRERYVVEDLDLWVGEWQTHVIFDRRWTKLAMFAG